MWPTHWSQPGAFDHRAVAFGADRNELLSGWSADRVRRACTECGHGKSRCYGGNRFRLSRARIAVDGDGVRALDYRAGIRRSRCGAATPLSPSLSTGRCSRPSRRAPVARQPRPGRVAQPVLFSVMVSLAAQWQALGIRSGCRPRPLAGRDRRRLRRRRTLVTGRSKVVAVRSRAVSALAGNGGMVSIRRPVERVHALIDRGVESTLRRRAERPVGDRRDRQYGRVGRAHGRMRAGRRAEGPRFPSTTPRIQPGRGRCRRPA